MLYFIPTPIGNLDDITLRALKLFESIQIFGAEDTRTFKGLLTRYKIGYDNKQFIAVTSYTAPGQLDYIISTAKTHNVGIVSEAGTPGLSDPAKELIKLCREHNCAFEVLPGANALIPAVVGSPYDTTHFSYHGFLPTKKGRKALIDTITTSEYASFIYESVHRVDKFLQELIDVGFEGTIGIFRELSKMYEQKIVDTPENLLTMRDKQLVAKGEFVIGIYPPLKTNTKINKYPNEKISS